MPSIGVPPPTQLLLMQSAPAPPGGQSTSSSAPQPQSHVPSLYLSGSHVQPGGGGGACMHSQFMPSIGTPSVQLLYSPSDAAPPGGQSVSRTPQPQSHVPSPRYVGSH